MADLRGQRLVERVRREARHEGHEGWPAGARRLVNRVLRADAPNLLRLWDITEHPTGEGQLYFSLLQKNVLNRRRWTNRDDLRVAIITWLERTYHRHRRQP